MSEPALDTNNAAPTQVAETVRLFIALALPRPIVNELAGLARALRTGIQFTGAKPKWTDEGAMHLTLAFLGNHPAAIVPRLAEALAPMGEEFGPQRLEIRGLGVFPHWQRPSVLWAGVRDRTHHLPALHDALHRRLGPFGYQPENKPFRPHITLARFKDSKGLRAIEKIVHDHERFCLGPFEAGELVLFQSRLEPSGAVHHPLHAQTLRGKESAQEMISR